MLVQHPLDLGADDVSARPGDDAVAVQVADTGPGIPAAVLGRLFVPSDRLGAESGPGQGAGPGLPLARGITEAMGGELTVESCPGAGTTFAVILPAAGL